MTTRSPWYSRKSINNFVLSKPMQNFIIVVILINAAILGLETVHGIVEQYEGILHLLDKICLWIFIIEIVLKLYGQGWKFFTDSWNVFDFVIVGIALVPGADGLAVLRALRVLRVLRLISVIPSLRRVVDALVKAIPGIASIAALLAIVFYVGAVMATMLFGHNYPKEYGTLPDSLFSLFQIMTLDGWSDQVRKITETDPWAPAFFVPFVLISALTVLNLFIAVIVDAMQGLDEANDEAAEVDGSAPDSAEHHQHRHTVTVGETAISEELAELRNQIVALTAAIDKKN